ncbi:ATP-binding protein [Mycobacterium branderi]|uniref:ATP/GTP-binding protein n=1 Tax=Mycobacterium branderi TaxID=43348 RepID=A0A7I7WG34_9MYCO|nr:ATP-binding protein [Mycobacterium branderi]MCV7231824.1 ATP-binding protein [Mycobacterium branderi]ORA40224.1 hypothetical protein BST20_06590 [Mycobacterium branderi]BBZ15521.1 ATP/GTP-binding protein [Mycobacterium branderi]
MSSLAPLRVVGNLRLTSTGVYADYLLSGLPFIFLSEEWQNMVAAEHAELSRTLPSGCSISGLTVPVPTRQVARKMLVTHPDLRADAPTGPETIPEAARRWVQHCWHWEPTITGHRPRRRIYWLSLPLDYGPAGQNATSIWRHWFELAIGRDKDSASSLSYYRELAAQMTAALPGVFFPKPASAEQIWWHWNYTASRGVWPHPLPSAPHDPDASLPASAFSPVYFDPSAARLRRRRWRAARTDTEVFLRAYREPADDVADSYQVLLPLESFPDTGISWPRATIFKVLDDLTRPDITLDWTVNFTFEGAESAASTAQNVVKNIRDQYRQRGRHALSDDELVRKLASGKELASELKRGAAERGVNPSIVIAAAGADPDSVNHAAAGVLRAYRRQNIGSSRWRGSQPSLWRAFNPGTEKSAKLGEFRNPTTSERFAKYVPLLANKLGNNTGVPLGMNLTSPGLRDVVLLDLLDAPARDNPANLVICGSPGRGKSHVSKNLNWSWLMLGAGLHIFDPTDAREHECALADFDDKIVIDLSRPGFSLDGLRIFPYNDAAERTIDHLLPQLGFSALSRQAARLRAHLAPETREANGIGSTNQLIRFLRELKVGRDSADDDLLVGLEGLRTERVLRALFDETLPVPDLAETQCVIWNFAGLELPAVGEEYAAHLHELTTPGQRAAQALYGLGADLAQSLFFSRPERPDILEVEECAAWTNSPGGQKCANKVIRQGRKAWTGFVGISQHPIKDFAVLEDEFIDQRLCLGFNKVAIAKATLEWCDRDLQRHPELLKNYVENTSPVQLVDHGDDAIDTRYGKVIAGREGEAWYLDEFGGFGKVGLFEAPTAQLAARFDTNPQRVMQRRRAGA